MHAKPASRIGDWLGRIRVKQIRRAQEREIRKCLDPVRAAALAQLDRYSRVAALLPRPQGRDIRLLELGCGPGKYVALLASLGYRVVGVDPLRFDDWGPIEQATGAELLHGIYAEKLPFADHSFDCATFLGTLLYLSDPDLGITELRRVVKPGAPIVIRTVNRDNAYTRRTGRKLDPASRNLYSMAELIELAEKHGLEVKESFSYGYWPSQRTDLWWYLANVWLPDSLLDYMSAHTKAEYRANNIIFALNRA